MSAADRIKSIADSVSRRTREKAAQGEKRRAKGGTRSKSAHPPRDWYKDVSDRVLQMLEGKQRPCGAFKALGYLGTRVPVNGATGKIYSGMVNRLLLSAALPDGSTDPRFVTYKQAQANGWQVKKGAKSVPVIFYKPWVIKAPSDVEGEEAQAKVKTIYLLKGFPVFHASQVDGIPSTTAEPSCPDAHVVLREMCEAMSAESGLKVETHLNAQFAFWDRGINTVMWNGRWDDPASLSMLAHELVHASSLVTGRIIPESPRIEDRAQEELVAEVGSAYLRARLGLDDPVLDNHSEAYLQAWRSRIAEDKRDIFRVMREASRSVEWLCDHAPAFKNLMAREALSGDTPASDITFDLTEAIELASGDLESQLHEIFGDDAEGILEELTSSEAHQPESEMGGFSFTMGGA